MTPAALLGWYERPPWHLRQLQGPGQHHLRERNQRQEDRQEPERLPFCDEADAGGGYGDGEVGDGHCQFAAAPAGLVTHLFQVFSLCLDLALLLLVAGHIIAQLLDGLG